MQDLGTLPGDVASVGNGINDAGDVVGISLDSDGNPTPYLWHDGVMNGLNDLIAGNSSLFLLFASAINTRGEISGFGATEKGDVHGFLATPISGTPLARDLVATGAPLARPVLSDDARKLLQRIPGGFVGKR
jgi:probable HAF family extracellular repeat protein